MKEMFKQILIGIDGLPSTKRVLMLYIGVPLWTFVHVALVYIIKPFDRDMLNTVIMYDFALICMLGGMNVWERGQKEKEDPATKSTS